MINPQFRLVAGWLLGTRKPLPLVQTGWQTLVAGLRANLERLREQPKYPPLEEEPE